MKDVKVMKKSNHHEDHEVPWLKAFMFFMSFMVLPGLVWAQVPTPEIFVSVAAGQPSRFGDQSFGTHPNVGGGAMVSWRKLGFEVEANRTLGLKRQPLPCALERPACLGATSAGLTSAVIVSTNVLYRFGGAGARTGPYVTGGIGAMWTKETTTVATFNGNEPVALMAEFDASGTGLALNAGAGFRMALTRGLSLRPEVRIYSSTVQSRLNLSVFRFSVAAGYQW